MSDVERLTVLLFWPFTPSITQSYKSQTGLFHLPAPSPVPRLVLISEPRVCEGVSVRVCAKVDERKFKGDGKKQRDAARSMHEDRKQTGDEENRGPKGDDEEHSRSQESSVQSPTVGSFSSAFPLILPLTLLNTNRQTCTLAHLQHLNQTPPPPVSDSMCVCRYYIWRVDWSIWSWNRPCSQWWWRCRTSSRVRLRRCGCLGSCQQQSLWSDRSTSPRWMFTHPTNPRKELVPELEPWFLHTWER